jgi:hypothetical protein
MLPVLESFGGAAGTLDLLLRSKHAYARQLLTIEQLVHRAEESTNCHLELDCQEGTYD